MGRSALVPFWHSRLRLSAFSFVLAVLVVVLNLFNEDDSDTWPETDSLTSFNDDVDYAVEALDYMFNLQLGKAEIRPVVEKPKRVNAYWRCRLKPPSLIPDAGWVHADDLYLFSATYDRRQNSLYPSSHILQVLAMSFRPITKNCYCNIFDTEAGISVVVDATVREIWQRAWDPRSFFYVPNLISCPVPSGFEKKKALAVSIADSPCKAVERAIRVRRSEAPKGGKRGVAVCVKGMDFLEDLSTKFVEWIEAQYLMGADLVTVYSYYVPPSTQKILDYYVKKNKLVLIPITLPGMSPNQIFTRSRFIWRYRQQKRRHELIPYNDCLYRYIDTHEYILIVDTDELVVPLKSDNWTEMLREVTGSSMSSEVTSVSVRNVFKFPTKSLDLTVPDYMFMLRNRRRTEEVNKAGDYGKSFTNTNSVATVFNHFALHRQHANVAKTIYTPKELALKLHYKSKCPIESRRDCPRYEKYTVEDTSLDRFAPEWLKRVDLVLRELIML